jgi:hypothetical protein
VDLAKRVAKVEALAGTERLAVLRRVVGLSGHAWRRWVALALYPHAARLGDAFAAVLEEALADASGPGVRHPGRFVLARLKSASPGPRPARERLPFAAYVERLAKVAPPEPTAELSPDNPFAVYLERTCPHGDHPASDTCCPAAVRDALERERNVLEVYWRTGRHDDEAARAARRFLDLRAMTKGPAADPPGPASEG